MLNSVGNHRKICCVHELEDCAMLKLSFPHKWSIDSGQSYQNSSPDIHTKETRSDRDTCTPMFIAALFVIARTWKQPRCPSADEWTRKLWYIYTMEYYSAIEKNSFELVLMRWMKPEPIIQSEVSQKDKHQYSILTHMISKVRIFLAMFLDLIIS